MSANKVVKLFDSLAQSLKADPPRALSLTRPWPWCFTAPIPSPKRIENRSYTRKGKPALPPVCTYRGELYLHAAQSWDPKVGRKLLEAGLVDEPAAAILNDKPQHPTGIVARCRAVGHLAPSKLGPGGLPDYHLDDSDGPPLDLRWWFGGYALVLADVEPLAAPVPCKGRLGVWRIPEGAAAQLRRSA